MGVESEFSLLMGEIALFQFFFVSMISRWQPRIVMYSYWTKLLTKSILQFYEVLDQFTTHGILQNDPNWLVNWSRSQQKDLKLLVLTLGQVFWPKGLNNIYQSFV